MNIKLYATYLSSSSERVRIALAMKKLDYEYVSVRDIGWDEIRKINPQGLVPAMALGDQVITQSNAILHFLEERVPNPSILPSDLILRAQARAFAQAIVCEMHAVDILRIRKFLSKEIGVDNAGLECWSNHWFTTGFSELETTLSARTTAFSYCFGDTPGWAERCLSRMLQLFSTRRFLILPVVYQG